jgi:hypothetical protein
MVLVSHAPDIVSEFSSRGLLLDGDDVALEGFGVGVAERDVELLTSR